MGSLHLYENDKNKAEEYLNAGFQPTTLPMGQMPDDNPWEAIKSLLAIEKDLRTSKTFDDSITKNLNSYWTDLAVLLQIFSAYKNTLLDDKLNTIDAIRGKLSSKVYDTFIRKKVEELTNKTANKNS